MFARIGPPALLTHSNIFLSIVEFIEGRWLSDGVVDCVVVVVVGKRLVNIFWAIRTRWRFLFVLSINTLSPFC